MSRYKPMLLCIENYQRTKKRPGKPGRSIKHRLRGNY